MMERLPVELIRLICGHLCPHCQSPNTFPQDADEIRSAKASLAHLSRTSKAMCAIAQPFVFHYYATGNLPYISVTPDPPYCVYDSLYASAGYDDLLKKFLRSVIQRPDLARCIQALQFAKPYHSWVTWVPFSVIRESPEFPAIAKASVELGAVAFNIFHPDYMNWTPDRPDPKPRTAGPTLSAKELHHIWEQLAILLCPNARTILLQGSSWFDSCGELLQTSGRTLPALKTVGLLSLHHEYHYTNAGPLLSLAPNLETVYGADVRDIPCDDEEGAVAWEGTFPHVSKVVMHDDYPEGLLSLAEAFPLLRDFQYTHTTDSPAHRGITCRDIIKALDPVRKTLRRLAVLVLTEPEPEAGSDEFPVIESLQHFEKLEELALNQEVLYGLTEPEQPLPGGLAGLLPRSITRFRISHVDRSFRNDLRDLARDAPDELPHLRSVQLNCLEGMMDDLFSRRAREALEDVFDKAGISLSWGASDHEEDIIRHSGFADMGVNIRAR